MSQSQSQKRSLSKFAFNLLHTDDSSLTDSPLSISRREHILASIKIQYITQVFESNGNIFPHRISRLMAAVFELVKQPNGAASR
jgi:hypothetical protein